MVRLTRAQQQERTRDAVLAAAREEFVERGYVAAKVDRIAERAELTRGAVYSNFPSKRALYLAVLVDSLESVDAAGDGPFVASAVEGVGAFARAWLQRLPLTGETPTGSDLRLRSLTGVVDDGLGRAVLADVARLEALLLALAVESCAPRAARRVRLAELVLTMLAGAGHLARSAPGFGDAFDVARGCEHLAGLEFTDTWDPPHLAYGTDARRVEESWQPPAEVPDAVTGHAVDLDADGVVVVLGAGRLGAAEEAVRAAGPGDQVTVAVVTSNPAETGRVVRVRVGDLAECLRRAFPPDAWGGFHVVLDERAAVASAVGVDAPGDDTEVAVRVRSGQVAARAEGRGAGHAAAAGSGQVGQVG